MMTGEIGATVYGCVVPSHGLREINYDFGLIFCLGLFVEDDLSARYVECWIRIHQYNLCSHWESDLC